MYLIPLFSLLKFEEVQNAIRNHQFWFCILLALLLLSFHQSTNLSTLFYSEWHNESYFNKKIGTQLSSLAKYVIIFVILGIFVGKSKEKVFGLFEFNINYKTYFWFIIIMLPLIIFASTQESFLTTYPKFKQGNVSFNEYSQQLLVFEPLYLINFIGIEWFFRGFMVLFFMKFLNYKSVVLVAMIYCSFHFGKPILECISSFFGGYLLGYMVYSSKSIWGGVIVHMGIAFLMDFTAFIASSY